MGKIKALKTKKFYFRHPDGHVPHLTASLPAYPGHLAVPGPTPRPQAGVHLLPQPGRRRGRIFYQSNLPLSDPLLHIFSIMIQRINDAEHYKRSYYIYWLVHSVVKSW